ncbi:TPA: hypothetical protein RQN76_003865 [Aeromonas dhakensis]|nr:hypothetical protein [Aeromonas dhakensis]
MIEDIEVQSCNLTRSNLYIRKLKLSPNNTQSCSFIHLDATLYFHFDCVGNESSLWVKMAFLSEVSKLARYFSQGDGTLKERRFILAIPLFVMSVIEKELVLFVACLHAKNISLVIDVGNFQANKLPLVCKLVEQGVVFSMRVADWSQIKNGIFPGVQFFDYVRITAPRCIGDEVYPFIDLAFELKEHFGLEVIVERLQSRTQLCIAKNVPYYGLLGDFIYKAKSLDREIV